jgi:hypothetical protein
MGLLENQSLRRRRKNIEKTGISSPFSRLIVIEAVIAKSDNRYFKFW